MVRGLFPRVEQPTVLDVLARSVVFVHRGNVERLLKELSFDIDAWRLANMYLYSVGAKPLHGAKSAHVGMGIHKTSYVSMLYFGRTGPFEDFVIHEAAHVFHNCKRRTIGLREIRHREWLLPIAFVKREIFAYTCEAYGRILEQSKSPAERKALFAQYAGGHVPSLGEDRAEHLDILESAVAVRNGWKEILRRCHEPKPLTRKEFFARMMAEARGRVAS
jgi:hypothetical protein